MGMGFAPTWLRQVAPLLHKTTLTTVPKCLTLPVTKLHRVKIYMGSRGSGHMQRLTATTASEKNKEKCITFTHLLRILPWMNFH